MANSMPALLTGLLSILMLAGTVRLATSETLKPIQDITWTQGPRMRYPIKYQAHGVIDNWIINACGTQVPGRGGEHWSNRAWLFDPQTHSYQDLPDAPLIIGKTAGATSEGDLYVVSGTTFVGEESRSTRQVWRLSRQGGAWKWQELPPLPFARIFPGVVVADRKLIVIGGRAVLNPRDSVALTYPLGQATGIEVNTVQCLDLTAPDKGWYDLPPIPRMARSGHAVAAIGRQVFVFGGACYNTWINGFPLTILDDAYALDLASLRWRQLRRLPKSIWSVSAVPYGEHQIIILGGHWRERQRAPGFLDSESYELYQSPESPNVNALVYDVQLDSYRTLPSQLPTFPLSEEARQELARMKSRNSPSDWVNRFDFSKGSRRVLPRVSTIGNSIYVIGSSVDITEANAADEFLIGKIVP